MSLRNQRTTEMVQGAVSLSRMAINEPGMTRFRLSICARMRQPESLRSLTCQIWGTTSDGSAIESDMGAASALAAKSGEKVGTPNDEMLLSFPGVAADEVASPCFCPLFHNSPTMLEKPAMAWTARATG